jgi:hypothetical protein
LKKKIIYKTWKDRGKEQESNMKVKKMKEEKIETFDINITVKLKNNKYNIYCGEGNQNFKWLIDVCLHYYERNYAFKCGK